MDINDPKIEALMLDETEGALREFTQVAINAGAKRMQMVLMLRRVAADFEPKLVSPAPDSVQ
jgi:hypothetical protein